MWLLVLQNSVLDIYNLLEYNTFSIFQTFAREDKTEQINVAPCYLCSIQFHLVHGSMFLRQWRTRAQKKQCVKQLQRMQQPFNDYTAPGIREQGRKLLERLTLKQLQTLTLALQGQKSAIAECLPISSPSEDCSHFITCRLWRWPDLAVEGSPDLIRLPLCDSTNDSCDDCLNPFHYARLFPDGKFHFEMCIFIPAYFTQ